MFDTCDPIDDLFENSEFDRLHMTIGLQSGRNKWAINQLPNTVAMMQVKT